MMGNIRRNRTVLAAIAATAIFGGLVLAGGLPKTTMSAPAASEQQPATTPENSSAQSEQFMVRDYSEFGGSPGSDLPSSDWLGLLGGMVFKLAIVIALIYLAIWALRRYVYQGRTVVPDKRLISLRGSLNLSPSRTVYVLEVGRKVLVIGASQNQLTLLTEVTDQEAMDEVRAMSVEVPPANHFSSLLNVAKQRFGPREITLSDASVLGSIKVRAQEGLAGAGQPLGQD